MRINVDPETQSVAKVERVHAAKRYLARVERVNASQRTSDTPGICQNRAAK